MFNTKAKIKEHFTDYLDKFYLKDQENIYKNTLLRVKCIK